MNGSPAAVPRSSASSAAGTAPQPTMAARAAVVLSGRPPPGPPSGRPTEGPAAQICKSSRASPHTAAGVCGLAAMASTCVWARARAHVR